MVIMVCRIMMQESSIWLVISRYKETASQTVVSVSAEQYFI